MAATPLLSLLLLAAAATTGLCVEVSNKLDFWEEEETDAHENEVEPRPPPLTVVDVHVLVANGSAGSTDKHRDVPIYVPVELVTPKPATSRPWKHHGSYAPSSTVSVQDVPVYVPVANSVSSVSSGHKVHYDDVPVLIGSSGVKHVKTDDSQKAVPVVIPISINISTGKEDKSPAAKHPDVPIVIGKPPAASSNVPPDVPVVYGLNLGPQFHRRGGGGLVRPAPPLQDRTFWWPPVVAIAPRPWLPPVQLPHYRPQPPQPPPRPVAPSRTTTTTTTTASSLVVDGKLDFGDY
ncbi:uncharacterized protein LOC126346522 isoform X1 [Schistocerca gregaria]|uniref:uncharacterized protein LOC126346522 isoform X1 n=1 Tax=Schistocerca gregaria TaxID=7010 RepID=UPI00211E5226|nr:uncharacterized protein LOC126346522 isoform X1 [Schistocerca gregaria]